MAAAVTFLARAAALDAVAAAATGDTAQALAERLLLFTDDALAGLRGVAAPGLVAVMGETAALPWVDGIVYLGRDGDAPRLLMPTTLRPTLNAELFEEAIARHARGTGPWAVLAAPPRVIPFGDAVAVERSHVLRWLGDRS